MAVPGRAGQRRQLVMEVDGDSEALADPHHARAGDVQDTGVHHLVEGQQGAVQRGVLQGLAPRRAVLAQEQRLLSGHRHCLVHHLIVEKLQDCLQHLLLVAVHRVLEPLYKEQVQRTLVVMTARRSRPATGRVDVSLARREAFVSAGEGKVAHQVFVAAEFVDSTPGEALVRAAPLRCLARVARRRAEAPASLIEVEIYDLEAYLRHGGFRTLDLLHLGNTVSHDGCLERLVTGQTESFMTGLFPRGCRGGGPTRVSRVLSVHCLVCDYLHTSRQLPVH